MNTTPSLYQDEFLPSLASFIRALVATLLALVLTSGSVGAAKIVRGTQYIKSTGGFYDFPEPVGRVTFNGSQLPLPAPINTDTVIQRLTDVDIEELNVPYEVEVEVLRIAVASDVSIQLPNEAEPGEFFDYDFAISLTSGTDNMGMLTITQHQVDDCGPAADGTYISRVELNFTVDFIPRDGAPPLPPVVDRIVIESVVPRRWSFDLLPNANRVEGLLGDPNANTHTNLPEGSHDFYLVEPMPLLSIQEIGGPGSGCHGCGGYHVPSHFNTSARPERYSSRATADQVVDLNGNPSPSGSTASGYGSFVLNALETELSSMSMS